MKASGISFSNAKINFRADDLSKFKATGKAKIEHLITADVDIGNITGDVRKPGGGNLVGEAQTTPDGEECNATQRGGPLGNLGQTNYQHVWLKP